MLVQEMHITALDGSIDAVGVCDRCPGVTHPLPASHLGALFVSAKILTKNIKKRGKKGIAKKTKL